MKYSLLALYLLSLSAFAQEGTGFRNDREGKSFYSSNDYNTQIWNTLREVDGKTIISSFQDTVKAQGNSVCSYDVNSALQSKFEGLRPGFRDLKGAIFYLRSQDEIDDVAAGLLLRALEVTQKDVAQKDLSLLQLPTDKKIVASSLDTIAGFEKNYLSCNCFDAAFKQLRSDVLKGQRKATADDVADAIKKLPKVGQIINGVKVIDSDVDEAKKKLMKVGDLISAQKKFSDDDFEALLFEALNQKRISASVYRRLEQARMARVENDSLSLASYLQKKNNLRIQYPVRDYKERSGFVNSKAKGTSLSLRQKLLAQYSDVQIILMGNVIKNLRKRLESPKVEILIYDKEEQVDEKIALEPMERFRFAIKLLKKEMKMLSINTYFGGREPAYLDLMTASYELSIIPASELETVANLQDIWSPKKTFWQKAQVWVQSFSSVATIVLPTPYGFIPAIALVAIQATKGTDDNTNDDSSLF